MQKNNKGLLFAACLFSGAVFAIEPSNGAAAVKPADATVTASPTKSPVVAPAGVVEQVLIEKNGVPLLTASQFEDFIKQVTVAEPQIAFYMQMNPDEAQSQLFKAKWRELVLGLWGDENKVRDTEDYKQQFELGRQALDSMLLNNAFHKANKKEITDKDVKDYYDQFKEKDPDLGTPGGVKAKGLKFEDEAKAKAFLTDLKAAKNDFDKAIGQKKDLKVRDFGLVSKDGFWTLDSKVKTAILDVKKVPTADVVKVGPKEFWIFVASEKKEPEYEPFETVKEGIRQKLSAQSIEKMFDEKIPEFAKKYGVVMHEDRLKKAEPSKMVMPEKVELGQAEAMVQKPSVL